MGYHVFGRNRDFACQGSGQHDPIDAFLLPFLHVGGSQQNGIDLPAGLSSDDFSMDGASLLVHWVQPLFTMPLIRLITPTSSLVATVLARRTNTRKAYKFIVARVMETKQQRLLVLYL